MIKPELDPMIGKEINNAQLARDRGNEGQARVCARRAAGLAVRKYFEQRSLPHNKTSAYELLLSFSDLPDIPSTARQNAIHLTMRVTSTFQLPVNVDLIEDARSLCEQLANL